MHPAIPAAPLTEADVLAALRDCYDPGGPLNIVDLGLVYNIAIAPDPDAPGAGIPGVPPRQRVAIALTPVRLADTESDAAPLIAQIQNRLAAFETIHRTEVCLLNHPVWTPDRISPEGYARLANHLTSKRPPNALVQIKDHPAKT
jgi:metal-sulfur cluster biosynthetic enzyme